MTFLIFIYNGFILGFLFSILAFQNQWLEMRINVGLIIFLTIFISIILYIITLLKKKVIYIKKLRVFTLCSLFSSFIITFLILGSKRIITLPASILRESMGLTQVSFGTFNIIILLIILIGIVPILFVNQSK
jgi:hypothetical protein